mmetsp:Transcript_17308/g.19698  ORF Transcript_17308/g.19698 Transcript_17308/m.19698 type:complete len:243 (+) Transcript_17308:897-1625(+)
MKHLLNKAKVDLDQTFLFARENTSSVFPNRKLIDHSEFCSFNLISHQVSKSGEVHNEIQELPSDQSKVLNRYGANLTELTNFQFNDTPILRIRKDCFESSKPDFVKVFVNDAFVHVFGLSGSQIELSLRGKISAYLPFGASVLSLLVAEEHDLLSFVEVMCVKNALERPTFLPWYSEIPFSAGLNLLVREAACDENLYPSACSVYGVFRRLSDEASVFTETHFALQPSISLENLSDRLDKVF